jgi:hypothetical protein
MLVTGGQRGEWSLAARGGVSIPLGRTEENPFELGRQRVRHQHIQFGTGTWNPLVGMSVGRHVGSTAVFVSGLARLVTTQNEHGYRAGHRYDVSLVADRPLGASWRMQGGFDVAREQAERWNGIVEEEGNLGRTDLLASAALVRQVGAAGALTLQVKVPLLTRAQGAQVDYPVIVSLGWSR